MKASFPAVLLAATLLAAVPLAAQTRVVMLGTGTPNPDPERAGPATAIVVDSAAYIVDAGAGVVRRAAAAERAGISALRQRNLRVVFLTHLHSDHTLGLVDLMFTPWVRERTVPLVVIGPPGTRAMVDHLQRAFAVDKARRQDGWQPQNRTGWQTDVREVAPGVVYQDSLVRVTSFRVPHGNWSEAFGYRLETRDRVIVISGDTRASEAVVEACNGCDVLVHEVYGDSAYATLAPAWARYHGHFHTSASALAELATRARPGLLV